MAVDWKGEVYSLSRWTAINSKVVAARLDGSTQLLTVAEVQAAIAERVSEKLRNIASDIALTFDTARLALVERRDDLMARQRNERNFLREVQAARWVEESRNRAERFRKGLKGLWNRVTGRWRALKRQNETEVGSATQRDRDEWQAVVERQLSDRRDLQRQIGALRDRRRNDEERLQSERLGQHQLEADPHRGGSVVPVVARRHQAPTP